MVLEKTLESPLDNKEIKPVHPKGDQSWICIGRTDAEAETPILWPPDVKNWFLGKDPDAGKDWRHEEKGKTEVLTVGWHHWLDGHECEQDLGVRGGQGSLACCSPWCCKESDMTKQLNWTELKEKNLEKNLRLKLQNILKLYIQKFSFEHQMKSWFQSIIIWFLSIIASKYLDF